jgi:hypothetical protein
MVANSIVHLKLDEPGPIENGPRPVVGHSFSLQQELGINHQIWNKLKQNYGPGEEQPPLAEFE